MSEKLKFSTEAPNLTLEQFENYDVSKFSNEELKTFIKEFYNSHPNIECWCLNKWDVSHITDMSYLFSDCSRLISIIVSKWNTSNVTNMKCMFNNCSKLRSIGFLRYFKSKWNTSNVTNMKGMFNNCSRLESINNINCLNTSNVTDMSRMFYGCSKLESIDLSKWNISKVKYMFMMFGNCQKLKSINLSGWNISNVEHDGYIFDNSPFQNYSLENVISHSPMTFITILEDKYKSILSNNTNLQKQVTSLQQENEALKELIAQLMNTM